MWRLPRSIEYPSASNLQAGERVLDHVVDPVDALIKTVKQFVDSPPDEALLGWIMQDPFDYDAEDALISQWDSALKQIPGVNYETEPGYGMAYSGPGGRERSQKEFVN